MGHTVHSDHRRRGYRRADSLAGAVDLAKVSDVPWAGHRNEDPSRYCCNNRRLKAIEVRQRVPSVFVDMEIKLACAAEMQAIQSCGRGQTDK